MEISPSTPNIEKKEEVFQGVSLQMRADAFAALTYSLLREPFMNSDLKAIILRSAVHKLSEKYTEDEIAAFNEGFQEIIKRFFTKNSFMG